VREVRKLASARRRNNAMVATQLRGESPPRSGAYGQRIAAIVTTEPSLSLDCW
jgi:hypothetical protein